jgi:PhnB protein
MQSKLNPYIAFKGEARQAMEFYKSVFGGTLDMTTFAEAGVHDNVKPDELMHAMLVADNGITIMSSDTFEGTEYTYGTNISISLSGDNEAELTGYYNKLVEGGTVNEPLAKAPWGDTFGMLTDKFGIHWMVNITGKKVE